MDTTDELKRDAHTEQLRRDGELPDEWIEPEDITAKASSYFRAMQRADRQYSHDLTVNQRAELYERADREREELLDLINAYGTQCYEAGIATGMRRYANSVELAKKVQA
jgi:hypothetical protein